MDNNIPQETLDGTLGEDVGVALRPGEIGEVVGENDDRRDTTQSIDPVETVGARKDDSRGLLRDAGESALLGGSTDRRRGRRDGSVRLAANETLLVGDIVVVRLGVAVPLLAGRNL